MGRPSKLTPERQEKITQAILAGNYFETACRYAGIGESTGYEWLARGEGKHARRKQNALYAQFAEAVRQSEAQTEVRAVALIQQGLPKNPRLALDFLARRFPDRWGPKEHRMVSGPGGKPIQTENVLLVEVGGDADEGEPSS